MRAGQLDRSIILQTNSASQSTTGEVSESWSTLATVWAKKIERGGREFHAAQQVNAETQVVFRIRHRTDVNAQVQISFDSVTYEIMHVMEIGRAEGLDLLCKAQA